MSARARLALVLVLLSLAACAQPVSPAAPGRHGVDLFGRPWRWTDERGDAVAFSQWRGAPLVVTAIFTSCTARCPLTVEKLRDVDAAFRRRGTPRQFLLVTLDPRTDNPARLLRFKQERHLPDAWHLLRGNLDDTRAFGRMLGVRAIYDDGHIDHDVRIAVFDGARRLVREYAGWDFNPNQAALPP